MSIQDLEKTDKILLLNFEDDTTRAVLEIDDKYIEIIKKWYEKFDFILDIEHTDITTNASISDELNKLLNVEINWKDKKELINDYIPNTISLCNNIQKMKEMNKNIKIDVNLSDTPPTKCIEKKNTDVVPIYLPKKEKNTDVVPTFLPKKEMYKIEVKYTSTFKDIHTPEPVSNPKYETLNKINVSIPENIVCCDKLIKKDIFSSNYIEIDSYKDEHWNNSYSGLTSYNSAYNNINYTKDKLDKIYVLIQDKLLKTITMTNLLNDELDVLNKYTQWGISQLFCFHSDNSEIIKYIEDEWSNKTFNNIEEINDKLNVTSKYIDYLNKHNKNTTYSTEESMIKEFFNSKYEIDDDINHKIKASIIYNIVIDANKHLFNTSNIAGFRNRLSVYLKNMNLKKKRYNDGYYYYGVVEKSIEKQININSSTVILDLKQKRKEEEKTYDRNSYIKQSSPIT